MDIEITLFEILDGIKLFPEKDKTDVKEFIDHDEWGIALETICSVVLEEKIIIDHEIYNKIMEIGNEMDVNPILWNDISKLLKPRHRGQ